MFPQEFIDQIKDTVDMVKLVEEYTDLKKAGPNLYMGYCPHPDHADSTPSFRVWSDHQSWCCMGCHNGKKTETSKNYKNYGSDCIAFIRWIENLKWKDAVIFLANKYHIPIPSEENDKYYKQNKIQAQSLMYNLQGPPLQYLNNRGLTKEQAWAWGIGFDGVKLTFPLFDRYMNVLGFTRRWLDVPEGANDKYNNSSNSKIFNKSKYLYGIHKLDDEFDEIRITEGPMDVILASNNGAKNVVATLGTAFTEGHIEMIKHYGKTPVFCMDGDAAGLKAINKAITLLADAGIYSKVVILPEGKDLCDLSLELGDKIEEYLQENAKTYGSFLLEGTVNMYMNQWNSLKLKFIPEIKEILKHVPSQDEQAVLKGFIKTNMGIDL